MNYPKFIITKAGFLRMGMVRQHKDLLRDNDLCYGGGYYEFDYLSSRIVLSGASFDFGRPKWLEIKALHLPSSYKGWNVIYQYEDGEIFNIAAYMTVDFYD